jgi:hypothetical protein
LAGFPEEALDVVDEGVGRVAERDHEDGREVVGVGLGGRALRGRRSARDILRVCGCGERWDGAEDQSAEEPSR